MRGGLHWEQKQVTRTLYCSSTHSSGSISVMTGSMNSRNWGAARLLPLPVRHETLSLQAFLSLHARMILTLDTSR